MKENEVRTILNIYLRKLEKIHIVNSKHYFKPQASSRLRYLFYTEDPPNTQNTFWVLGGSTVQNKYHNLDAQVSVSVMLNSVSVKPFSQGGKRLCRYGIRHHRYRYLCLDDAYALNSIVNHFQTSLSICVYAELTNTFQCN